MILEEMGKNIEKIRTAKGWTINHAAKKAMIEWVQLKNIETGKSNPTIKVIYRIAKAWRVPIIDFFKAPRKAE